MASEIQVDTILPQSGTTLTLGNASTTVSYDGNTSFDAGLTVTGTVTADGVDLGDNEKIRLGASQDLEIYHDGGHSYVADVGNGALKIRGTNMQLENTDGSKRYANFTDGAQADLYYNNSKKFETTSTGVTVTGTVTATSFSGDGSGLTGVGTTWESKSTAFTAEAAKAYFCDTSSAAFTATLPSSASAGDEVRFLDVAGTFDTNNLTVGRNGHNIQGDAADLVVSTERAGFALVYYNATQGWLLKDK